jgi:hypothetical protein
MAVVVFHNKAMEDLLPCAHSVAVEGYVRKQL